MLKQQTANLQQQQNNNISNNNKQQTANLQQQQKNPTKTTYSNKQQQHNIYFLIGLLCSKTNAKSYSIFSRVNILTSGVHKQSTYFRVSIYSFGTHLLLTL